MGGARAEVRIPPAKDDVARVADLDVRVGRRQPRHPPITRFLKVTFSISAAGSAPVMVEAWGLNW